MKEKLAGKFIVLDGPDGCGKSTQARRLVQWLCGAGVEAVGFRDPGDTAIGDKIREILLSVEHEPMGTRTELLLYMAARAQLWKEKVAPSLAGGKCVVLDRWLSSTCAYQGHAGGFGVEKVVAMAADCLDRVWPDLTVVLDVDPATATERMDRTLDRMESKGAGYHAKVREGFLELAAGCDDFAVVDARGDVEDVHEAVVKVVSRGGLV